MARNVTARVVCARAVTVCTARAFPCLTLARFYPDADVDLFLLSNTAHVIANITSSTLRHYVISPASPPLLLIHSSLLFFPSRLPANVRRPFFKLNWRAELGSGLRTGAGGGWCVR